jgi:hypothetical protein
MWIEGWQSLNVQMCVEEDVRYPSGSYSSCRPWKLLAPPTKALPLTTDVQHPLRGKLPCHDSR